MPGPARLGLDDQPESFGDAQPGIAQILQAQIATRQFELHGRSVPAQHDLATPGVTKNDARVITFEPHVQFEFHQALAPCGKWIC